MIVADLAPLVSYRDRPHQSPGRLHSQDTCRIHAVEIFLSRCRCIVRQMCNGMSLDDATLRKFHPSERLE